ncbi:LysE family translocator [Marinobacter salinisoli]|uniref:LysE family translocator n=1 Tax=Marinobacter salinisoli TaxID=2769486 RepID=A0ABX7MMD2_9GAMM|nr:LysE family translocator [Marinobacter salinisoli]QSP93367.1 LysE family translocator [Marinobacter salinisoli]
MPTGELFWAFLVAITLLTITPGVDTLLVIRNTTRTDLQAGCVTSLGICSGLFLHAALSAVGISLILVQTAWAFTLLKWAGACYLIWLGLSSLRLASRRSPARPVMSDAVTQSPGRWRDFREGLLSNLFNPKAALFYMALLPQFVDPQGHVLSQSLLLAGVHFVLAMLWQCAVAAAVSRSRHWNAPPWVARMMHGITGGIFVGIGAKVAMTQA